MRLTSLTFQSKVSPRKSAPDRGNTNLTNLPNLCNVVCTHMRVHARFACGYTHARPRQKDVTQVPEVSALGRKHVRRA